MPNNNAASPDTRQKILSAARQEFVACGRAGARMQSIADRAGVNKALLHYYFRSKDLLYEETMRDILNNVWGNIRKELNHHSASDDLRVLVHTISATYIRTISENLDFARLLLREVADGGRVLRELSSVFRDALGDAPQTIVGVIQKNHQRGLIRAVDPAHFIINIMSMSAGTFAARFFFSIIGHELPWPTSYDDGFIQKRIEEITETVCNGIFIRGDDS
ncbi:MAG: TetR/AcrR family transcriptional regulator [Chitinivibrionales bacterium]